MMARAALWALALLAAAAALASAAPPSGGGAPAAAAGRALKALAPGDAARPWFCRHEAAARPQPARPAAAARREELPALPTRPVPPTRQRRRRAQRLAGYLRGENDDGARLTPTVPLVSVLATADRGSGTRDAPRPTCRDVRVVRLGRRAVWVDSFDEPLLTEGDVIRRGWDLIETLQAMGRKARAAAAAARSVDDRGFLFSLYDLPLPLLPHHYELGVRARCRRAGADPPAPGTPGAPGAPGSDDDDDDYPWPDADGGDAADDECPEPGGDPELAEALAAVL
ncbi:hypothetical protein HT031_000027 [Scenedesmus sp. PABB004]|nr:hypothetical protein HT031_000027 [Scenedesmus sp. PABB004]